MDVGLSRSVSHREQLSALSFPNIIGAILGPCAIVVLPRHRGTEYVANTLRMYCMDARGGGRKSV